MIPSYLKLAGTFYTLLIMIRSSTILIVKFNVKSSRRKVSEAGT